MTLSWCFADESSDESASVLESLADGEAIAPAVWRLEVANVLVGAERKGRIAAARSDEFVALLRGLPIRVESDDAGRAWTDVLALAREAGLSSYDASYLELALRTKLPLATFDEDLRTAARARGVALLPPD